MESICIIKAFNLSGLHPPQKYFDKKAKVCSIPSEYKFKDRRTSWELSKWH
jgi:hypothetical protein